MTDGDTPALLRAPQHGIELVDSPLAWNRALADLGAGEGPLAVDAERASGFRYSPRAYLVQVYRRGTTNYLVDPIAVGDLSEFSTAFGDTEWILHAAQTGPPEPSRGGYVSSDALRY
jgi:Ribonuclease D